MGAGFSACHGFPGIDKWHAVSAGFDAADGDELGECHVTPTGYAHMTHMLSGLAGGKLVVALEVCYSVTIRGLCSSPHVIGWLQSRLDIQVCSGGDACDSRRVSARIAAHGGG